MSFDRIVQIVIGLEGGETYTNNPRDPGGATKYGISQRAFPNVNIAALTYGRACEIYREHFWKDVRGDELPPKLALCVFDCAVNQGGPVAKRLLQISLGVREDGIIGAKTLAMVKHHDLDDLVAEYMARRARRYVLTQGYEDFGQGWMARLFHVSMRLGELERQVPARTR